MVRNIKLIFILLSAVLFAGCSIKEKTTVYEIPSATNNIITYLTPTPISTPSPEPEPTPEPNLKATILSAGDVIMHDNVIKSGKVNDDLYDYNSIFSKIKPYVDEADFSLISFEGVTLDSDKSYSFQWLSLYLLLFFQV